MKMIMWIVDAPGVGTCVCMRTQMCMRMRDRICSSFNFVVCYLATCFSIKFLSYFKYRIRPN